MKIRYIEKDRPEIPATGRDGVITGIDRTPASGHAGERLLDRLAPRIGAAVDLECAVCGGRMLIRGRASPAGRIRCREAHLETGNCRPDSPWIPTGIIGRLLVDRVRWLMADSRFDRIFLETAEGHLKARRARVESDLRRAEKELAEAEKEIGRLLCGERGNSSAFNGRELSRFAAAEKAAIADLRAAASLIVELVPPEVQLDRMRYPLDTILIAMGANDDPLPGEMATVLDGFRFLVDKVAVGATGEGYVVSVSELISFEAEVARRPSRRMAAT